MRVTTKGQVTIPQEIREKLGIMPQTEVEFGIRGNIATLRKMQPKHDRGRGKDIVARISGSATVKITTEEVMALTRGWDEDDDPDRQ
ncbi:AbrB/MazE/SpoVT family DNA-binding domain-containing protein [soil metagenome]